ncbi:unnamed protein product [Adineta ricciae]|uniref:Uncharacterized protein n=1 Tax=Adineta ricciae TaxID=249248 RepID=A0A815ICI6_ADIRI|nr:unnamed protein product [Adineta ricciae]
MKLLLFIFLLTRPEQYFFHQFIRNDTHRQAIEEKSSVKPMISNKVFLIIIACLFLVVVATILTVYLTKDQMKDFVIQMRRKHRGPTIHQFNPHGVMSDQQKAAAHDKFPIEHANTKRERTSMHAFMNLSSKLQQNSFSDYRHSQSAADLFLYR